MIELATLSRDRSRVRPLPLDALAVLLLTFFLVFWNYQTVGKTSIWEAGVLLVLVGVVTVWGRIVARCFGLERALTLSFPVVFLIGMAGVSSFLAMVRLYTPFDMRALFWFVLCAGAAAVAVGRRMAYRHVARREAVVGLLGTFLCLAAATAWTQHYLPPTSEAGEVIVYKPIRDHFIHAEQIILLAHPGDARALGRYGLAGEPIPFYHYASYALPALVTGLGGPSAYEVTFSYWLPMGLALMGMAAYALAAHWFGPRAGIWCLTALAVVPDPTYWTFGLAPLGVYLYSYIRFLQIAASNAYGIAVAGIALACITAGIRASHFSSIVLGMVLAALSLLFKAQVFVAAFPLCVLVALAGLAVRWRLPLTAWLTRRKLVASSLILASSLALLALPWTPFWERVPKIELEVPPGKRLTEFLVMHAKDDPLAREIALAAADSGGMFGVALRALLVLFLPFRFVLFLGVAIVPAILWRRRARWIDGVAALALAIYLAYALLLAPNITGHAFGNPWDLQFVPFCWAYFVLMIWVVGRGRELFSESVPRGGKVPITVAVALLLVPWWMGKADTDDWQTGQLWAYLPVPRGLVECADFLRLHAGPDDRIQDAENDPYYLVEALAERRAYAGWPVVGSYTARDRGDEIFQSRLKELEVLKQATTAEQIEEFLRASGIRWYLAHPESSLAWPRSILDRPAFVSGEYRVYDLRSLVEQ